MKIPDEPALLRLAEAIRDTGYVFVTPTPATHARVNGRSGNEQARTIADVFGWSRPFGDGVLSPALMALMRDAGVLAPCERGWRSLIRLSSLDDLLLVHSAYPTHDDDAVFFGPDTYRFAAAISAWLAAHPHGLGSVADIGCGSGAGALLIAQARPDARLVAVDINETALAVSRVNADLAGVGNVFPVFSDLLTGVDGTFDLIVSNPPYLVDPARRAYRHGGGDLGAGLSLAIVDAALPRLAGGGALLLYTGSAIVDGRDSFRIAATERCRAFGARVSYREVDPDVFGDELDAAPYDMADRIAAVVLTAERNE